jgi:hypothetical protein
MLQDQLREIFYSTLDEFLATEADSILTDCSEQMLCGRLAIILERRSLEAGFSGYKADVEYNRNFEAKIKTIINEFYQAIPIRCDLILHSRGKFAKDNLIAIEMKKQAHAEKDRQRDRERLKAMTRPTYDNRWDPLSGTPPEHICDYEVGFLLIINRNNRSIRIEEYIGGDRTKVKRKPF